MIRKILIVALGAFALLAAAASAATPPTLATSAQTSWITTTATKSVTVATQAGDTLVAYGMTEDSGYSETISGGTWTQRQLVNVSGYARDYSWTSTAASTGNLTVTFGISQTGKMYGGAVLVFRGSDGVGASAKANSTGGPSLGLTTSANSAIVVSNADWNAVSGASRTWRAGAGSLTEKTYDRDAARYTVYGGYHADSGAAGAKTVGLSAPTGQKYSISAVEVLGHVQVLAPPTAAFTFSPSAPNTGQVVHFDGTGSTCAATPCSYAWVDDGPDGPGGTDWPLGSGQSLDFTFQNAGTKRVRLTVTDAQARTATVEHDVVVSSAPPPNPQCSDGVNNDPAEDSLIDYPSDPGCSSASDDSELGNPVNPQCSDGVDNSDPEDTIADYPADPGCSSASDDDETDPAPGGCPAWPAFPTPGATAGGCTGYKHTGVTLTAYTGPSSITTAGTVIDSKEITTCLDINAPNVTIKRSYIHGCNPDDSGVIDVSSTGFLLEDTEIDGSASAGSICGWMVGSASPSSSWTIRRLYFYNCSDGLRVNGAMTIEDSYLGKLWDRPGDHNDGMQGYGSGGSATVRHNHLDSNNQRGDGTDQNATMFFADGWPGNVTVDKNWLAGGNTAMKLNENGHYWVTSNRVLDTTPSAAYTAFGIVEVWTDNRWISASGVDGATFGP